MLLASGLIEPILPSDSELIPVIELASDLRAECAALMPQIGSQGRMALGRILRAMNSYYSNKIEGQHTYPAELEDALVSRFSSDADVKRRQHLAIAHIETEQELEAEVTGVAWNDLFSQQWISHIHHVLYARLEADSLLIYDAQGNPRETMQPGELRTGWVKVGAHAAPDPVQLDELLRHFQFRYGAPKYSSTMRLAVAGAALHRLSWIHPFPDGNGRVSRLHNHLILTHLGLTGGLWSPMRGLARRQQEYYAALHQADLPRRNDTDGRGNLSSKGLAEWITFWLDVCLDQVRFMGRLLALDTMQERYISLALQFLHDYGRGDVLHHRSKVSPDLLGRALYQVFKAGSLDRTSFKALIGCSDRTASRLISSLLDQGIVLSSSRVGPLEPGFPFFTLRFLFPGLWPEAEGIMTRPKSC